MKIAVLGATGNIGSAIAAELGRRGHSVTGFARNVESKTAPKGVTLKTGDVADTKWLATALKGFDAVISALHFETLEAPALAAAVKAAGVTRFLVVGGAGSLYLPDGTRFLNAPGFPPQYLKPATEAAAYVDWLRASEKDLDWTFLSPPALIGPGERTGTFRLGETTLLADAKGDSRISYDDYAIAMADEVETSRHVRKQFTLAY